MSLPAYAMNAVSFPQLYEQHLVGPLFTPFAEMVLDRLALAPRQRVLDVACGTGIVARLARQRLGGSATVVGVDVSQPMLDVAAAKAPDVDWRAGPAEALPVAPNERFDVAICHQGVQFFRDKAAAGREFRRVLADGGRVAVAVWRSTADMPELARLQDVAEKHLGKIDDQRYGFGDADALVRLLETSGFRDVRNEVLRHVVRFDIGATFVQLNSMAFVGMSKAGASMSDAERAAVLERIVAASLEALGPGAGEQPFAAEMRTNFATART